MISTKVVSQTSLRTEVTENTSVTRYESRMTQASLPPSVFLQVNVYLVCIGQRAEPRVDGSDGFMTFRSRFNTDVGAAVSKCPSVGPDGPRF